MFAIVTTLNAQSSEKRNLGEFTGIDVNTAANITIIQSDTDMVTVNSKDDLHLVSTKVENGVLLIRSTKNVTCTVQVKDLRSIIAKDAAIVKSQNTLKVSDLKITEDDAGNVNLDLNANSIIVVTKDASVLKLSGTTSSLDVSASDGATVKTSDLKADAVSATARDGGIIRTWAVNKITAKSTDGGSISIKGSPAVKSTVADDGGTIKMDDGETVTGDKNMQDSTGHDSTNSSKGMKHSFSDAYIGFGYVFGPEHAGDRIKYGRSREFNFGLGGGYKFFKWNGIGADIYYKSTDFFLEPDADKILPNPTIHNAEKISFNNLGGLVFDRFFIGKIFFDGGIYYDWIFMSRHVTWDNYANGNGAGASITKTIDRSLSFVKPSDYGLQFRFGAKEGFSFYFNYRMSNLFKQTSNGNLATPELPPYVLGIVLGGF